MWLIALAIVISGMLVAFAIRQNGRQKQIDDWYENFSPEDKQKYERTVDQVLDDNVIEGFKSDAKKIKEMKEQGKSIREISKLLNTNEVAVKKLINSSFYRDIN